MTKLARDGLFPFILDNFFVVLFVCFYLLICSFLSKVELLSKTHVMLNQLTTVRKKKCCVLLFVSLSVKAKVQCTQATLLAEELQCREASRKMLSVCIIKASFLSFCLIVSS